MTERDLFVAAVAIGLGTMMLHAAIANEGWCFQMTFARKVSKHRGQESARLVVGSVGTFVILLGIYTLCSPYLNSIFASDVQSNENPRVGYPGDSSVSLNVSQ
jgi:hypothetical protein